MSRITAPASKLSRALLDSQRSTGAVLMPKYDELLRSPRRADESRHLTTTHRPTPQPSIANRARPLMQGFHSSTPTRTPTAHLDATVLPPLHPIPVVSEPVPRMPLLPDNYGAYHASISDAADIGSRFSAASIVASDPDNVIPGAPLAAVEGVTVDGVELKFAHEQPAQDDDQSTLLSDIFKGMVDDLISSPPKKAT
ncbi:hypothetical protein EDB81DRAFT_946683 [Dactylonectria macrodidyma]|uniref:Uncharacterized protein n=1 Tax=Dactylonectria macrodidyma TaxID=307937 RepID=A0A9P9EV82_9HYPO|nr:hypothetical protein EDB81DRAFT_946683 [Dactylonectria macrodidyma]